jgi:cytochrome d ubiquinol oxidase subunit II
MLLLLSALFFRPVGFEYRSKINSGKWRNNWDWAIFFGSSVPALLFGVAFGNLFLGVPFKIDDTMRSFYTGNFFQLLHPFAILVGVISLTLLMLQGGSYLAHRTEGVIQARVKKINIYVGAVLLICFTLAGVWVSQMNGMSMVKMADPNFSMNPLMKEVAIVKGAWLGNFAAVPALWIFPALVYFGVLTTLLLQSRQRTLTGFVTMSLAVLGMIMTAGVALFPFVMPSSVDPKMSLSLWDVASSKYTLNVMLWVAIIFVPIILMYTSWAYRVMRGKVTVEYVRANDKALY